MRLLLDTCVFLWACTEPERLSERAIEALETAGHEIWVSAASTWEIAVKHQLGKLPLPRPPDQLIPDLRDRLGATSLPIEEAHTLHLSRLPALHRDPFDRILVAQALVLGLTIVTPDEILARYPAPILW